MSSKRTIDNADDDGPPHKQPRLLPSHSLPYSPSHTHTPAPPFQQPLPLLTFSYTPSHILEFTDSALRYYVDPPRGADLNYGVGRWVRRAEERGRVDGLLRAWERIRGNMEGRDAGVGVVGWRGVLTKILTAPYEMRDTWELNVMCINGTMYFEEHLSAEKLREKNDISPHHRLQSYYGYAFESWCTSSTPPSHVPSSTPTQTQTATPNGWGGDVDTNVQWCCVVKTKLGSTKMILGGEVDCVRGRYTGRTDTLLELKTSLVIRNAHDEAKFERKLLKHYIQSYLLGVPEIIVGFRTPAGVLSTIQRFRTVEIPRAVRDKSSSRDGGRGGAWDASVCLEWGDRFLEFLKGVVGAGAGASIGEEDAKDSEKEDKVHPEPTVWRVTFTPKEGVSVRVLDADEVEDVKGCSAGVGGELTGEGEERVDRVGFLPRWFWDEVHGAGAGAGDGERKVGASEEARREKGSLKEDIVKKDVVIPPGWQI